MKKNQLLIFIGILFIGSLFCLAIELVSFYQMGIFVDEFSLSPSIVLGSDLLLTLTWCKLAVLGLLTLATAGGFIFVSMKK